LKAKLVGLLTMPVKEEMTAAPPVNSMAVTSIFVMMPKTVKTLAKVRGMVLPHFTK
jgi:hypothetical protein